MNRILFVSVALVGLVGVASADPSARHGDYAAGVQGRHSDKSIGYDDGMDRPPARQRPGTEDWSDRDSRVPPDAFNFLQALNLPPSHWEIYSGQ